MENAKLVNQFLDAVENDDVTFDSFSSVNNLDSLVKLRKLLLEVEKQQTKSKFKNLYQDSFNNLIEKDRDYFSNLYGMEY